MEYNQKMNKVWIVEFITEDDDDHYASFAEGPSTEDVLTYIGENDWLLEEMEAGTLEWTIFPIDFVDNKKDEN